MSERYTFVLGAADPEMGSIEQMLQLMGTSYVYAVDAAGARVTPRTAYAAVRPGVAGPFVAVECGGDWAAAVVCDHHRPGDPGYGRPPDEFLPASTLGQVISTLAQRGVSFFGHFEVRRWPAEAAPSGQIYWHEGPSHGPAAWWVVTHENGGIRTDYRIPPSLARTAAADHCLGAAYAGLCPGVEPGELARQRTRERAAWLAAGPAPERDAARAEIARAYFGRTPEMLDVGEVGEGGVPDDDCADDCPRYAHAAHTPIPGAPTRWEIAVRHAIQSTRRALQSAPRVSLGGVDVLDLREIGTLPELPTALVETGQCAIYRMAPPAAARDPRVKVGIIGAGEGTVPGAAPVAAFLAELGPRLGLEGLYGDPARGYAGGYAKALEPACTG